MLGGGLGLAFSYVVSVYFCIYSSKQLHAVGGFCDNPCFNDEEPDTGGDLDVLGCHFIATSHIAHLTPPVTSQGSWPPLDILIPTFGFWR